MSSDGGEMGLRWRVPDRSGAFLPLSGPHKDHMEDGFTHYQAEKALAPILKNGEIKKGTGLFREKSSKRITSNNCLIWKRGKAGGLKNSNERQWRRDGTQMMGRRFIPALFSYLAGTT